MRTRISRLEDGTSKRDAPLPTFHGHGLGTNSMGRLSGECRPSDGLVRPACLLPALKGGVTIDDAFQAFFICFSIKAEA
jgi:hypothetical protein